MTTDPTTPDDARQKRRDAIQGLLTRIGRGRAGADIAVHLLNYVAAEVTDGDQAREQLAEAQRLAKRTAERHGRQHRVLAGALGVDPSVTWRDLTETAAANLASLAAARAGDAPWIKAYGEDIAAAQQGEAEAVRAREAAEQQAEAARRRSVRYAERVLVHAAAADRNRDAWRNARKRAALMTAEVTRRAPLQGEYAARAIAAEATVRDYENRLSWETTCGEHAALLDSCRAAEERAERAEATLTAVRALLPDNPRDDKWTDHVTAAAVRAALGDPQPATEAHLRCVCGDPIQLMDDDDPASWIHSPGSDTRCLDARPAADPCAHGCRQAADDVTRLSQEVGAEQPAEPLLRGDPPEIHIHLSVTPAQIAAAITPAQIEAAIRRIRCADRTRPGDVL